MSKKVNKVQEKIRGSRLVEYENVDAFIKEGFKTHIDATRHANALPQNRDYDFYNAHESFKNTLGAEGDRILSLINKILRKNNVEGNVKNRTLDQRIELIVETNDLILENAANSIDDMNGLRKLPEQPVTQSVTAQLPVNKPWNRMNKFSTSSAQNNTNEKASKSVNLLAAKNIVRPQKFFKDKVDNRNGCPWMPRIKDKPNSLKPLALYTMETERGLEYCHPYECELDRFVPAECFLKACTPVAPKKVEDTPLYEISSPEQLEEMLQELHKHKEIAIDLEQHSYRSFMGITCLMQISTKDADYIIDTFSLRDKLHVLNEVFTKNSIVKIFHGADMDVLWLQRDLSLYIVNMFDTHKAAKQLGFTGLSLSYLLNRYCSFMPNKQFQLADWRIRPLPDELKSYAREDTHYLIYIYQKLKNELLNKANGANNILKSVFQASTTVCQKQFCKPILTDTSHLDFYRKCKRSFDNRQMFALKELFSWRDCIAREEDESPSYVLPNHMLLQISEMLPREVQGVLACCNPIPPLVKSNSIEIHQIMLSAREQPVQRPIMKEDDSRMCSKKETIKMNVDSPLHCPHDLTKLQEFRDDLPTILGNLALNKASQAHAEIVLENKKSTLSVFNTTEQSYRTLRSRKVPLPVFLSPYERYKLIKPFVQAEEANSPEEAEKNVKLETVDDPSVEDRIASLHDHFLKVTRLNNKVESHITEPSESLLALGGTKKRKREHSQGSSSESLLKTEHNLHTTIPSRSRYAWQGKGNSDEEDSVPLRSNITLRRKNHNIEETFVPSRSTFSSQHSRDDGEEDLIQSRSKFVTQRRRVGAGGDLIVSSSEFTPPGRSDEVEEDDSMELRSKLTERRRDEEDKESYLGYNNQGRNSRDFEDRRNSNSNRRGGRSGRGNRSRGRGRGGQYDRRNKDKREHEKSYSGEPPQKKGRGNFQAYDYSSVDYDEFRGGASGSTQASFNSKYRGKNNKNKSFRGKSNKSCTFGNTRGQKRGRAR